MGPDGKPRVRATVCPVRLADPDAENVVAWFLHGVRVDGWSGRAEFVADWPRPGGVLRQDARLVEATQILRAELEYLPKASKAEEPASAPPKPGRRKR